MNLSRLNGSFKDDVEDGDDGQSNDEKKLCNS